MNSPFLLGRSKLIHITCWLTGGDKSLAVQSHTFSDNPYICSPDINGSPGVLGTGDAEMNLVPLLIFLCLAQEAHLMIEPVMQAPAWINTSNSSDDS